MCRPSASTTGVRFLQFFRRLIKVSHVRRVFPVDCTKHHWFIIDEIPYLSVYYHTLVHTFRYITIPFGILPYLSVYYHTMAHHIILANYRPILRISYLPYHISYHTYDNMHTIVRQNMFYHLSCEVKSVWVGDFLEISIVPMV